MAGPDTILRPNRSSDFEILYAVDQLCFPKGIAYGRDDLAAYLNAPSSYCVVAQRGAQVAGFVLMEYAGHQGYIVTLDVLEPFRRQAIGSLLMGNAEQEAARHGVISMKLETATTNQPAIALWKKRGYGEIKTIKNYYGSGLHAFEMEKRLEVLAAAETI